MELWPLARSAGNQGAGRLSERFFDLTEEGRSGFAWRALFVPQSEKCSRSQIRGDDVKRSRGDGRRHNERGQGRYSEACLDCGPDTFV